MTFTVKGEFVKGKGFVVKDKPSTKRPSAPKGQDQRELIQISTTQFALAFHKFIHNQRNNGNPEDWNNLDEEAYQAALTGIFEFRK